jgi:hypothetical protein
VLAPVMVHWLMLMDVSTGQQVERQVESDGHRVHDTSVTEGQTLTRVLTSALSRMVKVPGLDTTVKICPSK